MSTLLGYTANTEIEDMEQLQESLSKQASRKPSAEEAAKAKALINFLMQDKFFLVLLRSNDPKIRAGAIDKLNEAHHKAYGGENADVCSME